MQKFLAFGLLSMLAACSTPAPTIITKDVDVPKLVYPDLPPVKPIPAPVFYPVQFLLPIGTDGNIQVVSACVMTAKTTAAALKCPDDSTNAFVGLDQQNYVNLLLNLQAARNYAVEANVRIQEDNNQRAEWQAENAATQGAK